MGFELILPRPDYESSYGASQTSRRLCNRHEPACWFRSGYCLLACAGRRVDWRLKPEASFERPLPFDRGVWDAQAESWNDDKHRRHRMADWLVRKGKLSGLTRVEVVALLGEPPATRYFQAYDLVYNLGSERGFVSIDSEWLLLKLDNAGRVEGIQQTTD